MENDNLSIDDLLAAVESKVSKTNGLNPYLHCLNAKVVCLNCNQEFRGTTTRQKKWFDGKDIVFTTFFCPCCPQPTSIQTWLEKVGCIKEGKTV